MQETNNAGLQQLAEIKEWLLAYKQTEWDEKKLRLERGVSEFQYFYVTQLTCISVVIELMLYNKLFQFALRNPP